MDVILGEHDRSAREGTEQTYSIECLYINKGYVADFPYHGDIALIKLEMDSNTEENLDRVNDTILPVCLPTKNEFKKNDICVITGWGYTSK